VCGSLNSQIIFRQQRLEELNDLERELVGGDTSFLLHAVGTGSEPSVRVIISFCNLTVFATPGVHTLFLAIFHGGKIQLCESASSC
jgi:hypothetical protein